MLASLLSNLSAHSLPSTPTLPGTQTRCTDLCEHNYILFFGNNRFAPYVSVIHNKLSIFQFGIE